MNTQEKIDILKTYTLFARLPHKILESLAQSAKEKIFPSKSYLIQQSKPAPAVYCVYKGLVQIYILTSDGKTIPIRVKGPPYIVGEMNLFDDLATTNIQAVQQTHALVLAQDICKKLIRRYPDFAISLLTTINEKLRVANMQTEYYFSETLKERVAATIKILATHFPKKEIPMSQEELSYIVGASRSKVTKALDQLAQDKVIYLSHKKIRLL